MFSTFKKVTITKTNIEYDSQGRVVKETRTTEENGTGPGVSDSSIKKTEEALDEAIETIEKALEKLHSL